MKKKKGKEKQTKPTSNVAKVAHAHGHAHGHDHDHSHDHSHDHDHDQDHEGGHGHVHGPGSASGGGETRTRELLPQGAGKGKTLFFDAPSGLAGDMIVAALVDLGVPEGVILSAVGKAKLDRFRVQFGQKAHSGIVATTFDVHVDGKQPERTYGAIKKLLGDTDLSPDVLDRAQRAFARLAESEARVHRMPLDDVHFHEVGAVDSIVDIIASAAALSYLGAEVLVSPLPMGRGFVKARHGVLPLPAPATVLCLRGFETYDAGIDFETVTPTGAAVVAANAVRSVRWPDIVPSHIGFGAGSATLADRPNLLRAVLGERPAGVNAEGGSHVVIEANVDDMTGEMVAYCIQTLLREGALDAWAAPTTMKKGRPGLVISAITHATRAEAVSTALIRESTTLGVRTHTVSRIERPRVIRTVSTPWGQVPIKVSTGGFGPPVKKPEFDACAEIARVNGVPLRDVIAVALNAAEQELGYEDADVDADLDMDQITVVDAGGHATASALAHAHSHAHLAHAHEEDGNTHVEPRALLKAIAPAPKAEPAHKRARPKKGKKHGRK